MKLLIATTSRPRDNGNFRDLCSKLREAALESNLKVTSGIFWTSGPGCYNVALEVNGNEEACEAYADALTMALMPAKWTTTPDPIPNTDTCDVLNN